MMYRLSILPAADTDVDAAATYIARDSLKAALRFYDQVESAFEELQHSPKRWPIYPVDHPKLIGIRKCSIKQFSSYLIFYRVEGRAVEVIRVLHGARDISAAFNT